MLELLGKQGHIALQEVADHISGEAKDMAPFDEGILTENIRGDVQNRGGIEAAVISVPSNAPSKDYAIPMHEGDYNLGEGSLAKQSRVGKQVGKGYITRAIDDNRTKIKEIITDNLKRGL